MLSFGVEVEAERSGEKTGFLSDDGDFVSQVVDGNFFGAVTIDDDFSFLDFHDSAQGIGHSTFSCGGTSNNTNLFSSFDFEGQVFENKVSGGSVSEEDVFKLDFSFFSEIWDGNVFSTVSHDLLDGFKGCEASLDLLHLLLLVENHPSSVDVPVVELKLVSKIHGDHHGIWVGSVDQNEELDDLNHQSESVSASVEPAPDASVVVMSHSFNVDKVDVLSNCVTLSTKGLDSCVSIDGLILDLRLVSPDFSLEFFKLVMSSVS